MSIKPHCEWQLNAELGEGPVWSVAEQSLWFVDIKGCQLHRFDPASGARSSFDMPSQPGFALPCRKGLLVGFASGLHHVVPATGSQRRLCEVEPDRIGNRLNDASVDAQGRLWFGSMDDEETRPTGALYCWHDGRLSRHDDGITITNGPVVSPDGTTLYHTQTLDRAIYAFDIDANGHTSRKRLFLQFDPLDGYPDGSAMDTDGCLWVAFWNGWAVRRYSPQGRLLTTVHFPCANVTKIAFGGTDFLTAYATTAWKGLSIQERTEQPLAGALFSFRVPSPGLSTLELNPDV